MSEPHDCAWALGRPWVRMQDEPGKPKWRSEESSTQYFVIYDDTELQAAGDFRWLVRDGVLVGRHG